MDIRTSRTAAMAAIENASRILKEGKLNDVDTSYVRSIISLDDINEAYKSAQKKVYYGER